MNNISPQALLLAGLIGFGALTSSALAQISITIAPPILPIYAQPPIPGNGYLWTPGYWSWDPDNNDYYWVPGTWVVAPYEGALWTPGYWAFEDNNYAWRGGYWGAHIGYYGGINYGYGYSGNGYQGGYWNGGAFRYNREANNIGRSTIPNMYSARLENHGDERRSSFNGGNGGTRAQPSKSDLMINNMPHNRATNEQANHENAAHSSDEQRHSVNHGQPHVAATSELGNFKTGNIEPSHAAPPEAAHPAGTMHAGDMRPKGQHMTRPNQQPQNRNPQDQHMNQANRPAAAPNQPAHQQAQQPHPAPQQARPTPPQSRPEQQAHPAPQQSRPAPQSPRANEPHSAEHR